MMERGEVLSSAASGSDGFTRTEDDGSLGGAFSDEDTLNLVEDAILRTLKCYSSHQQQHHGGSRHTESTKKVDGGSRPRGRSNNEEQYSADSVNAPPARAPNPENLELLSDLLEQVHTLRRNQGQGSWRPKETLATEVQDVQKPARSFDRRRSKAKKSSSEELKVTLEAAATAAKEAADAAEAVALSVARNTEAIEVFAKSMKSSKKRRKAKSPTVSDGKDEILKSNQVTHWALGFMAVTTIAWRFGVMTTAKGFTSKLNDPFGYLARMVGGGAEEPDEETGQKIPEKANFFEQLSHVELPSILQDDSDHKDLKSAAEKKEMETKSNLAKSAATMDVKTKEASKEVEKTVFSFANLFQSKPKDT